MNDIDAHSGAFQNSNRTKPAEYQALDNPKLLAVIPDDKESELPLGFTKNHDLSKLGAIDIFRDFTTQLREQKHQKTGFPNQQNDVSSFSQLSSYARPRSSLHDSISSNGAIVNTRTDNRRSQRAGLEPQENLRSCEHCQHNGTNYSRTCEICNFAQTYDPSHPFDPQSMAILSNYYSASQMNSPQGHQKSQRSYLQAALVDPNKTTLLHSFSNPKQNDISNIRDTGVPTSLLAFDANVNVVSNMISNNREDNNILEDDERHASHYNFFGSNNSQEVQASEASEEMQQQDSAQGLEHESDEEAEGSENETTTTLVHEILNFCATYRPDLLAHAHNAKSSLLSLTSSNSNVYTVHDRERDRAHRGSVRTDLPENQDVHNSDSNIGGGVGDSTTALSSRFASVSSFRASLSTLSLEEMMNAVTVAYEHSSHPVLATNTDLTHRRENLTPSILPLVSEITATRLSPRIEQYDCLLSELESASPPHLAPATFSVPFFSPPAEHSSVEKFLSYTEEQYDWNRLFTVDAPAVIPRRADQTLIAESSDENIGLDKQNYTLRPSHSYEDWINDQDNDYGENDIQMYMFE